METVYAVPFMESAKNAIMCKQPMIGSDLVNPAAVRTYEFSLEELASNALAFFVGAFACDMIQNRAKGVN